MTSRQALFRLTLWASTLLALAGQVPLSAAYTPSANPHCTDQKALAVFRQAKILKTNRIISEPTSGCNIWKIDLSAGDQVTLKVAGGSGILYTGFLINGISQAFLRAGDDLNDVRGTDCHMTVHGGRADEETCVVAGSHLYYLEADQFGSNMRIGVFVKHSFRQVVGTCNIQERAPVIPFGVTEYANDYQACPTRSILKYNGDDPSPYPFTELWRVHVVRAGERINLSGFLVTRRAWNAGSDTGINVAVERPVADPLDFPGEKICSIVVTPSPAATACTFPSVGDYILDVDSGTTIGVKLALSG